MIEIEAFLAIVDAGTFTGASAQLHISQPAISRRIDLLELELDTPLFLRSRSGAALTHSGRAFLPFARNAMASVRDGVTAVHEVVHGDQSEILLAIVGTLASTSLLADVRRFRAEHRGIRVRLRTANSAEVTRLVLSGEADLGLRYFTENSPFLENSVIAHDPLRLVAAAGSSLVPARINDPKELDYVPWIGFPIGAGSSGEPFAHHLERTLIRWGVTVSEHIAIDSLTAQKRMIEADFGVGMVLESAITEERYVGSLVAVEVPFEQVRVPIVLLRRKGGFRSRAMETLLQLFESPGRS